MDLVEFLAFRLDEDERDARAAAREHEKAVLEFLSFRPDDAGGVPYERPEVWNGGTNEDRDSHFYCGVWAGDGVKLVATMHDEGDHATASHIARHDPARVLAEVAAKRRIIELHRPGRTDDPEPGVVTDVEVGNIREGDCIECSANLRIAPCPTLRLLALPYAEHDDYRQEWKP